MSNIIRNTLLLVLTLIVMGCKSTPIVESNKEYLASNFANAEKALLDEALKGSHYYMGKLADFYAREGNPLIDSSKALRWHLLAAEGNILSSITYLYTYHPDSEKKSFWLDIGVRWNLASAIRTYKNLGYELPEPDLYNQNKQEQENKQAEWKRAQKYEKDLNTLSKLNRLKKLF